VSLRPAWATQQNPVSNKKQRDKEEKNISGQIRFGVKNCTKNQY
jgi:hypothetical protein